jgi:hypothetical protein
MSQPAIGMDASANAIVNSRIPYDNGFGDYSFGRLIDRWVECGENSKIDQSIGSFAQRVEELDGFVR